MTTIVRITGLAAGLLFGTFTFAQDKAAPARPSGERQEKMASRPATGYKALDISRMKEELKLSDEQVVKLKDLETAAEKEKTALDPKMEENERSGQLRGIMARRDKQVRAVLTPEQGQQWSEKRRSAMKATNEPAKTEPVKEDKKAEKK